jgi:HrpA-like RNA helicase
VQVGAINDEEEITALGHHLAALPVDVRIGKVCNLGSGFWGFQHIFDILNIVVM